MTKAPETDDSAPKRAMAIVAGLLVVGVLLAVIIALASGGGDSDIADSDVADGSAALDSRIPQGSVRQVSFAEIAGTPLPRYDAAVVDEAVGLDAPEFTASYYDNVETSIDPSDGTPRIILFLAHWCPHCQAEVTTITDWVAANGLPSGVEIVAVSTSVDEGAPNYPASTWLLRENWPFPVLRDSAQGDLAAGFGLSSFPYLVAIDGDGTVVDRNGGSLQPGQWEQILASLGSDLTSQTGT